MNARTIKLVFALALVLSMVMVPRRTSAEAPDLTFSVSSDVSPTDEAYAREGIAAAVTYLTETFHAAFTNRIAVNVRATADPTNPAILAFASGDFLVVFTGGPAWTYLPPALRLQVIVHEFVHIYQYDLIGRSNDNSPAWFIEGMAEYISFDVVKTLGIADANDIYDAQTWMVARGRKSVPELSALEEFPIFQRAKGPVYPLSYLGIDALVGHDPVGRLTTYLDLVAGGTAWRRAFEQAFGTSTNEFYAQFQHWLTEDMVAPSHQPDAFTYVNDDGVNADVTVVGPLQPSGANEQIIVIAQTAPNAACTFEFRDHAGKRTGSMQTIADGTGLVFWLETIPAQTPAGEGVVSVNCGGENDTINLRVTA